MYIVFPVSGSGGVPYLHTRLKIDLSSSRLAIDRSVCILTRPVVITGFNRSLLVDWWSIGRLKKHG